MKRLNRMTCAVLAVAGCLASGAIAATVDFDSLSPGTRFGGVTGQRPTAVVHTNDGIPVSVQTFVLGSYTGFLYAEVEGLYGHVSLNPLELNNISVLFDFAYLDEDVSLVTLEYWEFGGASNFAVNGHTIHELYSLTTLPTDVAPGVTAAVSASPAGGLITLAGDIDSFRIGGQELAIDNIVAVPEPAMFALLASGSILLLRRHRRPR